MRTPPPFDDELVEHASQVLDGGDKADILGDALRQFIQREAGRQLAALGGSQPDLQMPWMRRR